MKRWIRTLALMGTALALATGAWAQRSTPALPERPNIVVIMGDDIGYWNVGLYSHGMMVPTPNIDRIGREGMLFTDHYAEPSCTAGRAAFLPTLAVSACLTACSCACSHYPSILRHPRRDIACGSWWSSQR